MNALYFAMRFRASGGVLPREVAPAPACAPAPVPCSLEEPLDEAPVLCEPCSLDAYEF